MVDFTKVAEEVRKESAAEMAAITAETARAPPIGPSVAKHFAIALA